MNHRSMAKHLHLIAVLAILFSSPAFSFEPSEPEDNFLNTRTPGLFEYQDADAQEPTAPIHPGAPVKNKGGTLGFFFRDRTDDTLYASTAGHAVDYVGQQIVLWKPWEFPVGTVVAFHDVPGEAPEDWALIRIDNPENASVSVAHWSGPSGLPEPGMIQPDDILCHYGWGDFFRHHEMTQPRCGTLAYFRTHNGIDTFRMRGTAWAGDSGSPVIHYETGQAVGLLVRGEITFHLWGGMDICEMMERFSAHGFDLELATALYSPPPPDPTIPVPSHLEPHYMLHATQTPCFTDA